NAQIAINKVFQQSSDSPRIKPVFQPLRSALHHFLRPQVSVPLFRYLLERLDLLPDLCGRLLKVVFSVPSHGHVVFVVLLQHVDAELDVVAGQTQRVRRRLRRFFFEFLHDDSLGCFDLFAAARDREGFVGVRGETHVPQVVVNAFGLLPGVFHGHTLDLDPTLGLLLQLLLTINAVVVAIFSLLGRFGVPHVSPGYRAQLRTEWKTPSQQQHVKSPQTREASNARKAWLRIQKTKFDFWIGLHRVNQTKSKSVVLVLFFFGVPWVQTKQEKCC
ncbi:unnamed protein product, partial [Ixodes pacificus]